MVRCFSVLCTFYAGAAFPHDELGSLEALALRVDNSWTTQLDADPFAATNPENNVRTREVLAGHWVPVRASPLPAPRLVLASRHTLTMLGLSPSELSRHPFLELFSGGAASGALEALANGALLGPRGSDDDARVQKTIRVRIELA